MYQRLKSSRQRNENFLSKLAGEVRDLVEKGYYDSNLTINHKPISLRSVIEESERPSIVTEVKFSSPSRGEIRKRNNDDQVDIMVSQMERGGATAISVLTQPLYFGGSLDNLRLARVSIGSPILMKDIIIDERQIDVGLKFGADVILLIESLFVNSKFGSVDDLIDVIHQNGLEVLLEVNSVNEFKRAITSKADIIGINNRDLNSLELDLQTTERILSAGIETDKPIMSESGIENRDEIEKLSKLGVSAFLIGTSIMKSKDIESKVSELSGEKIK